MAKYVWSKVKIEELIHLYEQREPLWNTKHSEYRSSRTTRPRLMKEICDNLEVDNVTVLKKIKHLRHQYRQERRAIQERRRGRRTEGNYVSRWQFYSSLKFLDTIINPMMPTSSNLAVVKKRENEDPFLEAINSIGKSIIDVVGQKTTAVKAAPEPSGFEDETTWKYIEVLLRQLPEEKRVIARAKTVAFVMQYVEKENNNVKMKH